MLLQKITYATLAMPPDDPRHDVFDKAVADVKANLGKSYPLVIGGERRRAAEQFADVSPVNTDWTLGYFQKGTVQDAHDAIAAARQAFPVWRDMGWKQRVKIMRKAADLISKRNFEISAVVALEVGKNRMEALGDVQETADLIQLLLRSDGSAQGLHRADGQESPQASQHQHPQALWRVGGHLAVQLPVRAGGRAERRGAGRGQHGGLQARHRYAATPALAGRMLPRRRRARGRVQLRDRPRRDDGQELITNPEVDGITFTGSYDIGMHIYKTFATGKYPRPCIAEMGGKNPGHHHRQADLVWPRRACCDRRLACRARSARPARACTSRRVAEKFSEKLGRAHQQDRDRRSEQARCVVRPGGQQEWLSRLCDFCAGPRPSRRDCAGGKHLIEGELGKGYFCAPTIALRARSIIACGRWRCSCPSRRSWATRRQRSDEAGQRRASTV